MGQENFTGEARLINNNVKALKSGVWYTAANFLLKSIGIITTPIFTRILTKSEFGIYNNYISWLSILLIFATLNLESTLISARYDYENKFDEYIFSILALSMMSGFIWMVLLNSFSGYFSKLMGLDIRYINAMLIYLIFLPAVNLFQTRERYYFEYKKTVLISVLLTVGTSLLSVILVLLMENSLWGRILGAVIPTILLGICLFGYFVRNGKRVRISYWKYALPICLPYIPHLLSLTVLNSMDRIMITKWCGSEATAMYSLAYTCGSIVTLLLNSLNSAFAPWLGEQLSKKKYNEIRSFSKVYILLFFIMAIGIMLVAPEVLFVFGGQRYMEAKYVMTPVAMGCVCQFLYTLFVNVEQFEKRTFGMAAASVFAALVNFVLNAVFIPRYGYLAAAYTTLVGYICLLGIHMLLVYRMKLSQVYNYSLIGIITFTGCLIMIIITLLYGYGVFRYSIICIYALAAAVYIVKQGKQLISITRRKEDE